MIIRRLLPAGPTERSRLRPSGAGRILDLGCGRAKYPGALGVDRSPDTDADLVFDLEEYPYPLEDGSFEQILCQDVLEHVSRPLEMLSELHRVAADGGRIHVRTPHFSSVLAYSDFTHRHAFSVLAFASLEHPLYSYYTSARFRVVRIELDFWKPLRLLGVGALANRFPGPYERLLAFRFPAANIRVELEVLKPG